MAKEKWDIKMATNTLEIGKINKGMDTVKFFHKMDNIIKEIG